MSIIKTFLVNNGGMTYIKHNSDNFTLIDCNLGDRADELIDELNSQGKGKGIKRFISTHPDEDHIEGINKIDDNDPIINFYCVQNNVKKPDETESFKRYKKLRDGNKAYYIYQGCSRKWMNENSNERKSSGINILWPNRSNEQFKNAMKKAEKGESSANNISTIVSYSLNNGVRALWMGDLETEFMESIENDVEWPKVDILFAPHHGRKTGKVPTAILNELQPTVVVLGHAESSKYMDYYLGYNTIKRTSGGDIQMDCSNGNVDFYSSNSNYSEDFLNYQTHDKHDGMHYLGSITTHEQ